jgi:hypothetical protein
MTRRRPIPPEIFEETPPDPVDAASGPPEPRSGQSPAPHPTGAGSRADLKRKAGFYLADETLERFNRKFYELKLAGAAVDNKSALMEAALNFALDDLDRGTESRVLRRMKPGLRRR